MISLDKSIQVPLVYDKSIQVPLVEPLATVNVQKHTGTISGTCILVKFTVCSL
jgi:hypothetical protein